MTGPRSLPPSAYVDPASEAADRALFARTWFGLGRADQVADPGRFATRDVAGQSILLVRGRDGVLRGFANTCRHRGARLMDGAGDCRGIKCPFHA